MTLTVEDDFAAFVAARWAELEALALVTTLDPVTARDATTRALGRLRGAWADAVADGTPTLQTRRAVLERSIQVAGGAESRGPGASRPRPGSSGRDVIGVGFGGGVGVERDEAVTDALWHCLSRTTASGRAVLACALVCDLDTGETAHLLGMPVSDTEGHDRSLRSRLAAAHDSGRESSGLAPAQWLLQDDLRSLVDDLIEDTPEPPDPAGLVAAEAAGVRRRTLVLGGTAVVATATAAWFLTRPGTEKQLGPSVAAATGSSEADWASTKTWPARGALAADVGVQGLILTRTSGGSRLLFADDVGDRRIVLAAPIGIPNDPVGTQVRAWQGARGALPDTMEELELPLSYIDGVGDVLAAHLPQQSGSALVVLSRPSVTRAEVSRFVSPTPAGTVAREWFTLQLERGIGIDLSMLDVSPAMRLKVSDYDGPPASPSDPWIDISLSDGLDRVTEATSAFAANATGLPRDAVVSTVVTDTIAPGSILDPEALSATGGDGRVVVVTTRTPAGAVLRTVLAIDDGRTAGTQILEMVSVLPAERADAPVVLRLYGSGPDTGRFLVVAPGGARAQLLATSPNAYPVSKVTPFKGDTAVVSVINADDAPAFTLIVRDAKGRKTYDGVAPTGADLFDLWSAPSG
ncbi:MAG: hypothetical protein ABIU87_01585 [Ornithinibacter sp.]